MSSDIFVWIAAFLTIAIYSFLYKDNPLYKAAEHLFVGVSVGYSIVILYFNVVSPRLLVPLFQEGDWVLIFPALIGLLMVSRFFPKYDWLSRITIAFVLGISTGINLPLIIQASLLKQLQGTMLAMTNLNDILIVVGVFCVMIYFYFSSEHKGIVNSVSKIGILFIMVGFGASFGYTVMARISLLIGRLEFLFHDWIHLIK
ncbi:MAG: hypothetical protein HY762_05590 [Planctomycetes bacterium]|nr:hypothetical protein [Planctomycetota bacterium]